MREKEHDGGRFCKSRRGKDKIQGWMLARPGQETESRGGHREKSSDAPGESGVWRVPREQARGGGDAARATQGVRLRKRGRGRNTLLALPSKWRSALHLSPTLPPFLLPCSRAISEKVSPRHEHRSCRQGSPPCPQKDSQSNHLHCYGTSLLLTIRICQTEKLSL